jgi:putative GTP pyrophosphokinase
MVRQAHHERHRWVSCINPAYVARTWHTKWMSNATLDRLGERLRADVSAEDLTQLDAYRREFRPAYDAVVDRLRAELDVEVSGRPAKSTAAIVDKLRRGSMRLTQMQDIAGCRIVVTDVPAQDRLVAQLGEMFKITIVDRRASPSYGYRAVHVVAKVGSLPVEVQVRTELQHAWAELSEKMADVYGIALKYGGGPVSIRSILDAYSSLISVFEQSLELEISTDQRIIELKRKIRNAAERLATALRSQQ